MFTVINYNDQRKTMGDKYFLQYPNGNNLAALWKMFGCVRIEYEENIQKIEFRLFNAFGIDEMTLATTIMQLPLLFSKYETNYSGGMPKKIILKPKEAIKFLDNLDGIVDKRTTKIVTKEEYEKLRSSIGFIA